MMTIYDLDDESLSAYRQSLEHAGRRNPDVVSDQLAAVDREINRRESGRTLWSTEGALVWMGLIGAAIVAGILIL